MRLTRRALLRTTAAGLAAAGLAAPARLLAQAGGSPIRLAVAAGGLRALDPIQATQGADFWSIAQVFDTLVAPPDGRFALTDEEFRPALATAWTVSEDARSWVFTLREGVRFHHGYGEMTAEDVVFTFDRARSEGTAAAIYANIAAVEATGSHEVTFTLDGPDPLFLGSTITQPSSPIVSRAAVEERGEGFLTDVVGTGPYAVERLDPEAGVVLLRHDGFWGEPAATERVEVLYVADTTARTLALVSGEVDMIEAVRAPGWIQQIQAQDSSLVVDMTDPGSFNTLFINLDRPPFDDLRVRRALAHSIDRDALAAALAPMAKPSWTLSPPTYPTGSGVEDLPEELRYPYDPEAARALLAEAGHPDGVSFTTSTSQREDYRSIMLILQELMRPAGFDVQLEIIDHSAYQAMVREDANTLSLLSNSFPPVPLDYYTRFLDSASNATAAAPGPVNLSHYGVAIPGVDEELDRMRQASSIEEYTAIGREVELKVLRDLPILSLVTLGYTVMRHPRVDLGYEVAGGYARWRLDRAVKS